MEKIKEIKIFITPQKTEKILLTILALVAIFSVIWLAFYNQNFYYLFCIFFVFLILFYYFLRNKGNNKKEIKKLIFHENSEIFFEKNSVKILKADIFIHRFLLCFTALNKENQRKYRFVLFADNFVNVDDFRWLKTKLKFL